MLNFPNPKLPALKSLGIIGTGKLGSLIFSIAQRHGLQTVAVNRSSSKDDYDNLSRTQVWIDVASANGLCERLEKAKQLQIPVVVGTTGIDNLLENIKKTHASNSAVLISANFNPMVHLFYHFCESLYSQSCFLSPTETHIKEVHHLQKKDSPSGTALELRRRLERIGATPGEIEAIREGDVKGKHTLELTGLFDKWTIEHESLNRESFANGALLAAQWILNKRGFYHFEDVIRDLTPLKI